MWLAKTWRKSQEFGGYQTDLGIFQFCSFTIVAISLRLTLGQQVSVGDKREKQVEREMPELVFLALHKHCVRKIHFKSIGKLMGNGNKEVGNSTLLAGESPWQRKFKSGYLHIPKKLQSWAFPSLLFPKSSPMHRKLSFLWIQTELDCSTPSAQITTTRIRGLTWPLSQIDIKNKTECKASS